MAHYLEGFPVNVAPMVALFFCAVYYAGVRGAWVSVVVWLVSYPLLSFLQGYAVGIDFLCSLVGVMLLMGLAFSFKSKFSMTGRAFFPLVLGSFLGAVGFYFFTNCCSWVSLPFYAKTWEGFVQAQWTGHPSLPLPTWVFLRNSLAGNAVFLLLFFLSQSSGALFPSLRRLREETGNQLAEN